MQIGMATKLDKSDKNAMLRLADLAADLDVAHAKAQAFDIYVEGRQLSELLKALSTQLWERVPSR